jgi:hypothetical protein
MACCALLVGCSSGETANDAAVDKPHDAAKADATNDTAAVKDAPVLDAVTGGDVGGEVGPDAANDDAGTDGAAAEVQADGAAGDGPAGDASKSDGAGDASKADGAGDAVDAAKADAGDGGGADAAADKAPDATTGDVAADAPAEAGGEAGTDAAAPTAKLTATATPAAFGNVEVGVASGTRTWTLKNTGTLATGTLALTNDNTAEATATNGCTGTLAAGASCDVVITFKPSAGGARSVTLTLAGTPGGTVTLTLGAHGQYRLTVTTAGTGTVTSTPAGISCGATCSLLVDPGTVTLKAATTNGSGFFFAGWAGGGCAGPTRVCDVDVAGPTAVTATFSAATANLIFMTSALFAANLGGVAPYDAKCNQAATAAGLNNAGGTGYIAVMSDAASLATDRLGTARGWVRLDGKPFADTKASLFTAVAAVFNSVSFDETGARLHRAQAFTGSNADGSLNPNNCASWTVDTGDSATYGSSDGGPQGWVSGLSASCENPVHLLCMGKTRITTVAPVVAAGKKIWQSTSLYMVGATQTPSAKCQAERPAGVTTGVALLSTSTTAASAVLTSSAVYVRPDGTRVGTGAAIAAGDELESGVWQLADGTYSKSEVWSGSTAPADKGTIASTCNNWTDSSAAAMGRVGWSAFDSKTWFSDTTEACRLGFPIYCVEP